MEVDLYFKCRVSKFYYIIEISLPENLVLSQVLFINIKNFKILVELTLPNNPKPGSNIGQALS